MPEFFDAGAHGGAGGPDIVKEDIGGVIIDSGVWRDGVGVGGLVDTGSAVGANLGGVLGADEK